MIRPSIEAMIMLRAILGTASPIAGVITSLQEQVEWHLRVASLAVGLVVGLLSAWAIWKQIRKGK